MPFLLLDRDELCFDGRIMAELMPRAIALVTEDDHIARRAMAPLAMHAFDIDILSFLAHSFAFPSSCCRARRVCRAIGCPDGPRRRCRGYIERRTVNLPAGFRLRGCRRYVRFIGARVVGADDIFTISAVTSSAPLGALCSVYRCRALALTGADCRSFWFS